MKRGRKEMDAAYALAMREEGVSDKEIGIEIARREGRKIPYTRFAVLRAIKRFEIALEQGEAHEQDESAAGHPGGPQTEQVAGQRPR